MAFHQSLSFGVQTIDLAEALTESLIKEIVEYDWTKLHSYKIKVYWYFFSSSKKAQVGLYIVDIQFCSFSKRPVWTQRPLHRASRKQRRYGSVYLVAWCYMFTKALPITYRILGLFLPPAIRTQGSVWCRHSSLVITLVWLCFRSKGRTDKAVWTWSPHLRITF